MSCTQVLFHHSLASAFLHHHANLQDPEPTAHTSPATQLTVPANHSTFAPEQSNRQQNEENFCYSPHGFHNSTSCSSFTNSTQALQHAFSFTDLAGSRAQYVSANCVVVTHYAGDAATEVDEHFSRALSRINHQHQVISSTSNHSPLPNHPPSSCVTSQDKCRLTSAQDFATNGWRNSTVTPNMWSNESMCDNNNSSHLCSPPSSPLDLAGPRTAIPENTFQIPNYPEPWTTPQQAVNTTAFHFPTTSDIEASELSHRDLFWY